MIFSGLTGSERVRGGGNVMKSKIPYVSGIWPKRPWPRWFDFGLKLLCVPEIYKKIQPLVASLAFTKLKNLRHEHKITDRDQLLGHIWVLPAHVWQFMKVMITGTHSISAQTLQNMLFIFKVVICDIKIIFSLLLLLKRASLSPWYTWFYFVNIHLNQR